MLKNFRDFVKTYIDDIVFFFMSLNEHAKHLDKDFQRLSEYDVTLNSKKFFLRYSFIMLLKQIVNVFEMTTSEEKLIVIVKLFFSKTFKNLKTYLKITD